MFIRKGVRSYAAPKKNAERVFVSEVESHSRDIDGSDPALGVWYYNTVALIRRYTAFWPKCFLNAGSENWGYGTTIP